MPTPADYSGIINNTTQNMQNQVDKFNQGFSSGLSDFQQGQKGTISDYLTRYGNAVNALPNEQTLYNQIGAQQNIPTLQRLASQANIAVSNIPRDELDYARQNAGGGGLNNQQLQQLIQQKLYDLSPIAQRATQQYQDAQQLVGQQMQYAIDQQNRSLLPYQAEGQLLPGELNNALQGYLAKQQAAAGALNTQLGTEGTLTGDQLQQLTQLLYQQNDFNNQKALTSMRIGGDLANGYALNQQQAGLNLANQKAMSDYTNKNTNFGGGMPDSFMPGANFQERNAIWNNIQKFQK